MFESGCRNDEIGLRKCVSRFTFYQQSPFEHYLFSYRQDSLLEHGPYFMREPIVQLRAPTCLTDKFYAKSNFGECDGTDV
jgi:hypothetical protein